MSLEEDELKARVSLHIKKLMAENAVSEVMLSHETNISQSAINRIKNGLVTPSLQQASAIAHFFGITIDTLIQTRNNPDAIQDNLNYIPVLNANDLIEFGKKEIQGFCTEEDCFKEEMAIGFKFDKSFSCRIFNTDTILIVKNIQENQLINGINLFFIKDKKYYVGSIIQGYLHPIDNLIEKIKLNDVIIVGKIIKFHTKYIKEPTLIHKIINHIGENKLIHFLETQLNFINR